MTETEVPAGWADLQAQLDRVRTMNAWHLAAMAECGTPGSLESAGAQFLHRIRDSFIAAVSYAWAEGETMEEITDRLYADGDINTIADEAPSIWTSQVWDEFVDLQAFSEDPTELGFDGTDMAQGARFCLYIIADRLALMLVAAAKAES